MSNDQELSILALWERFNHDVVRHASAENTEENFRHGFASGAQIGMALMLKIFLSQVDKDDAIQKIATANAEIRLLLKKVKRE